MLNEEGIFMQMFNHNNYDDDDDNNNNNNNNNSSSNNNVLEINQCLMYRASLAPNLLLLRLC